MQLLSLHPYNIPICTTEMDSTSGVAVETPTQAVPSNDSEADEVSYKHYGVAFTVCIIRWCYLHQKVSM